MTYLNTDRGAKGIPEDLQNIFTAIDQDIQYCDDNGAVNFTEFWRSVSPGFMGYPQSLGDIDINSVMTYGSPALQNFNPRDVKKMLEFANSPKGFGASSLFRYIGSPGSSNIALAENTVT